MTTQEKNTIETNIVKFANLDNANVTKFYWIKDTLWIEKNNNTKRSYNLSKKNNIFMPGDFEYIN